MLNPSFAENWFQHDLFSLLDTNVQLYLNETGPAGYGFFWAVVEKLYQNGQDGLSERDIKVLAMSLHAKADDLLKAVDAMTGNDLLFLAANKRYYSRRINETLQAKADAREGWYAQKSEAGKASARSRKEKPENRAQNNKNERQRDEANADERPSTPVKQNERLLNDSNERQRASENFNARQHHETRLDETRLDENHETRQDDPQTPCEGGVGQSVVVPSSQPSVRNPVLERLDHGQLASLEESWGKDNVAKAADILADRVRNGRLQVRNVYGALNGLLAKLGRDGDISKPKPQRKMPCPSVDGSCPKCGAPLRQTSADGHEWECHACGIRYTSDGGSGWIEEQIGVMARMA